MESKKIAKAIKIPVYKKCMSKEYDGTAKCSMFHILTCKRCGHNIKVLYIIYILMDLTLLSKVRRNQQEAQVFKSHKSIEHDKTMYICMVKRCEQIQFTNTEHRKLKKSNINPNQKLEMNS